MELKWKQIPGFERYMVSNTGRVLSTKKNKVVELRPATDKMGYLHVRLYPIDARFGYYPNKRGKIPKLEKVHRLVAKAFLPKPANPEATEINHKDANKSNNNVSNLEWVTRTQNIRHSWNNGSRDHQPAVIARKTRKPFKVEFPDGEVRYYRSRIECRVMHGNNINLVLKCIHNNYVPKRGYFKGCTFTDIKELPEGETFFSYADTEEKVKLYNAKHYAQFNNNYGKWRKNKI